MLLSMPTSRTLQKETTTCQHSKSPLKQHGIESDLSRSGTSRLGILEAALRRLTHHDCRPGPSRSDAIPLRVRNVNAQLIQRIITILMSWP